MTTRSNPRFIALVEGQFEIFNYYRAGLTGMTLSGHDTGGRTSQQGQDVYF